MTNDDPSQLTLFTPTYLSVYVLTSLAVAINTKKKICAEKMSNFSRSEISAIGVFVQGYELANQGLVEDSLGGSVRHGFRF